MNFFLFYAHSPDTAVRSKLNFNAERKWAFLQPFMRLTLYRRSADCFI